jgi:hypothetical protein
MHLTVYSERMKERDRLKNLHVKGALILKWSLKEWGMNVLDEFQWLSLGLNCKLCEHDDKPSGAIKDEELPGQMSGC